MFLDNIININTDKPVVGIDIGTSSIKLVELSDSDTQPVVEGYACHRLKAGSVFDQKIKNPQQVVDGLFKVLAQSGSKAKKAVVCLSAQHVFEKTITVSKGLGAEELEATLRLEVNRNIPHHMGDLSLDFFRTDQKLNNNKEEEYTVVVCSKSLVAQIESVLKQAKLQLVAVDVDMYALQRATTFFNTKSGVNFEHKVNGVMDFGADTSRFSVFSGGEMLYNKTFDFGGQQLLDRLYQCYGFSCDEAMRVFSDDILPDAYKKNVMKPFVASLLQGAISMLQSFYSSTPFPNLDQVVITGGAIRIDNITQAIERRLVLPVRVLNPFVYMRLSEKIDEVAFKRNIPVLSVAVGLALREMQYV